MPGKIAKSELKISSPFDVTMGLNPTSHAALTLNKFDIL